VLGNGPTLPVAVLPSLRGRLTLGVNRILRSGFAPTIIMWVDATVWPDEGPALDAAEQAGALLISSVMATAHSISLPLAGGCSAWDVPHSARTLLCRGNTAVMAARWALDCLRCSHVYMLGCNAEGVGDFYGENPHHAAGAVDNMQRELGRLLHHYAGRVDVLTTAGEALAAIAATEEIDEAATIRKIRRMLA
jgi:hypothetical protein